MKIEIKTTKELEVKYLQVDAGVRYWEDGEINGVEDDEENPKMPFAEGDRWVPLIDVDKGQIVAWPKGTTASIHYKICDDGNYYLFDSDKDLVSKIEDDYVPDCLGGGDYIEIEVDENGFIESWGATFYEFGQIED